MSEAFSSGVLALWAFAAVRVFAILRVQPQWRAVVGPWWDVVAAAFGIVLAPLVVGTGAAIEVSSVGQFAGLVLIELLLGTVIGLFVSLAGHALMGAMATSSMGLGLRSTESRSFVGLGVCVVLATALTLGLHRPLFVSLEATLTVWPIGRPGAWAWSQADLLGTLVLAAHAMTVLALSLATPVLLSLAVVDLATRLLGRGPAPAEPVMDALRPWARTAAALVALGASWSAYPEAWARSLG